MAAQPQTLASSFTDLSHRISSLDKHGYLFGQHLTNSWSPFLHSVIYKELGLNWGQIRLDSSDMSLFLRLIQHPSFYGASITMPNKVAIIPHLDYLTPECRDTGACNTLFLRSSPSSSASRPLLCGANTDVIGIRDSFIHNVSSPKIYQSRPALIIGSGGAARSAVYALRKSLSATTIYIINRDPSEVQAVISDSSSRNYGHDIIYVHTLDQARSLATPGAIVSCVPDLAPSSEEEHVVRAIAKEFFSRNDKGAMLEMCYNPTPFTRLGAMAEESGWQVILGTEALIWQGLEQDRYWTGRPAEKLPQDKVKVAIAGKVAERVSERLNESRL